jgi:membrane protein
LKLPGKGRLPLRDFLKRLYAEYERDSVSDSAAQIAYYLFFSLFPFLFFLATLTAYLPLDRASTEITARLAQVLPGDASRLVNEHLQGLIKRPRPHLLTLALIGSIWSASRGVDAVRTALNLAYDVRETRPWWKTQLIAIGATCAGAILGLVSISILLIGGDLGYRLAGWLGIAWSYHRVAGWLRWPVTAIVVTWVAALSYYLLPDVKQEFKYITPGSLVATILWLLATWGFGFYSSHWGGYDVTYGSLGGVVVLLTWFLISALVFLIGGEVNAILEHASVEGKAKGEHVEGEKSQQAPALPIEAGAAGPARRAAASGDEQPVAAGYSSE